MIISEDIFAMLLTEGHFKQFTKKAVVDASKSTDVMIALSQPSKDAVKTLAQTAFANGGKQYADPQDHGFMFQWGFEDPDGHIWELVWMDPAALQK